LNGSKGIFLYAEQGLGDTLQFARYAKLVADCDCKVIFEVQQPLRRVLEHSLSGIEVISRGDPVPSFEYRCPLMSLPLAFRTKLHSIPTGVPYLRPTPKA